MNSSEQNIRTRPPKDVKALNRRLNPTRIFVDRNRLAFFWFLVAGLAIAVAIAQPLYLVARFKERERVVILDPAGTYYVSPLLEFEAADELHAAQGTLATQALLNCSPQGFDSRDLLEKIYLPHAVTKADALWKTFEAEFTAKQIHQKAEIARINILETRENYTLVEVTGQLIRSGVFGRQSLVESPAFRLAFKMIRNPDMTQNGRFPTAVTDFQYETP